MFDRIEALISRTDKDTAAPTLSRSGLKVEDGALVKRDRRGSVIAVHPLIEVLGVELETPYNWDAFGWAVAAWCCAALTVRFLPLRGWGLGLAAVLFAVGVVFLLLPPKQWLKVETHHGDARYQLAEGAGEASGFVVELRRQVSRALALEDRKALEP